MNPKLARNTLITIVSNSSFMRGLLFGRSAWGNLGFPDPVKEPEEHKNLVKMLRDMADAVESLKDEEEQQ
jgi:hypothetical protein